MKGISIFLVMVALTSGIVACDGSSDDGNGGESVTLTIDNTDGGRVTVNNAAILEESVLTYDVGTVVSLNATPDSGYQFVHWTGDVYTVDNIRASETIIIMNGDYSIMADFEVLPPAQYSLNIIGPAHGSVTTPGEGTFAYDEGAVVNLIAEAEEGYRFTGWTADVSTIGNVTSATTTITMEESYFITANVVTIVYGLTITSTAGGNVTAPGEGEFTYDAGTVVSLVVETDDCYRFANWTGDVDTIGNATAAMTAVTMNADYSITASFEEDTIVFPDPNLEAAIREATGKPTGDICPSDLVELTSLVAHTSNIAQLTGLERCTSLTWLNLGHNQISSLSALFTLTDLTGLNVEHNQISDITVLANLTSLTGLSLNSNHIGNTSALANLTGLTGLNLQYNQISDISPLAGLTNLIDLRAWRNQISDISALANLTSLTHVHLWNNQISDISPLAGLSDLTELGLLHNEISDISPLANLTSLSHLLLHYNEISDVSPLVDNTGLGEGDYVNLVGNPLSDDSINIYIPELRARGVDVNCGC